MIRSRIIPAAALASALFLLAPPLAQAGQLRAAESPRSGSAAYAALADMKDLLGSLWSAAAAALGFEQPAQAGESADPAPTTDEGSSLDPHG